MSTELLSVILLAGGKGLRMGSAVPKQFLLLKSKPIACYSLEVFLSLPEVNEVIVVCAPEFQSIFSSYPVKFAIPGERRQDSVFNGLREVTSNGSWVCVHDGARPFINREMIQRLFTVGKQIGAATVGMPVKCTVKQCAEENFVGSTLVREQIWEIQTPQLLSRHLMEQGFQIAKERQLTVTDDVSLAELIPHPVKLVEGSYSNLKITTHEDLMIAEHFAQSMA